MLAFIGSQIGVGPETFAAYARREETRWEHLGELQAYLGVRPFQQGDSRAVLKAALEEAAGTDCGEAIFRAMINYLREQRILLPASITLEKIGLAARALARKRAQKSLVEGLEQKTIAGLEALITVGDEQDRTPLVWVHENAFKPSGFSASARIGNNGFTARAMRRLRERRP